jgi:hypothetical protein
MDETIFEKQERLFAMFEKMGESEVSIIYTITPGYSPDRDTPYAQEWLRLKQEKRDFVASEKRDTREEETLAIAKEANLLAAEANSIARVEAAAASRSARYAMYAAAVAATVAIAGYKDQILELIQLLQK